MKPVDVKSSIYTDFNEESNKEDSKLEVRDRVRISKCKTLFAKIYFSNWSEEAFVIKKIKSTVPWTYVISIQRNYWNVSQKGIVYLVQYQPAQDVLWTFPEGHLKVFMRPPGDS